MRINLTESAGDFYRTIEMEFDTKNKEDNISANHFFHLFICRNESEKKERTSQEIAEYLEKRYGLNSTKNPETTE